MDYHEKLRLFLKSKNLSQKEMSRRLDVSPTMLGRYFMGTAEFSSVFVHKLMMEFPDVDLRYIFSESEENLLKVEEAKSIYYKEQGENMITQIDSIQKQLSKLKKELAQFCHNK
ncbi:helix-turn-helix transcriptional regulator [Flavobacterium sp. FZUC8N2.13]|uniref:Helix-turn-helix transcriptional regulator n=1 Tax=Flavobacterium zubiriense TaxID=3138075 RepID=A0ABV4TAG9_9FLAO